MKKFLAVLLSAILCAGCAGVAAQGGPGGFAAGSAATVQPGQVMLILEAFGDNQGTLTKDFTLPESVVVDAVAGTLSFYGLNGHCDGKSTATVGYLSTDEGDSLLTWDLQAVGDKPVNIPVQAQFSGGAKMERLHFEAYNDLCTPTNFRVAVSFHRIKKEE